MNTPMSNEAIRFRGVKRAFGDIVAIDDLDLSIPAGSVTVLLGPNGAGKTTTVRLVTGALAADGGSIATLGLDPIADGTHVRARCGVVPPKPALYDRLTGSENLRFAAEVFDAPRSAIADAAARFDIAYALDQEVAGYSTGMRTRLALARAVLHDPDILLLDEPTAGLDPESARAVLYLIRDLAGRGRTIVMCTHLLHEAEGIADQVVLMDNGHARAAGHPATLAATYLADPRVLFDAEDRTTLDVLAGLPGVLEVANNGVVEATLDDLDRLPDLVVALVDAGARLTRVEPMVPTLEHLYFEMQRAHREPSS